MSITVNGQPCVPPGFRFHPTEEELLNYYLRKKVACEKIELDVIRDVHLNKLEPWDIQEECKIGSTPQNDWYFFSHKDKKYPTGTRTNRATAAGFWKATGRDKVIYASIKQIGMRKTLVFYKGRASHGHKSDWIMHEYRLDDTKYKPKVGLFYALSAYSIQTACLMGEATEDGWVICRVFKKKNHHKSFQSPNNCSYSMSRSDGKTELLDCSSALGQILQYMGRSSKEETRQGIIINNDNFFSSSQNIRHPRLTETILSDGLHERRFMKLPAALIPNNYPQQHHHLDHSCGHQTAVSADTIINDAVVDTDQPISSGIDGWSVVDDRTDQLNGEEEEAEALKQLPCCFELEDPAGPSFLLSQVCSSAQTGDLWST